LRQLNNKDALEKVPKRGKFKLGIIEQQLKSEGVIEG
jgi:hypothetical protein